MLLPGTCCHWKSNFGGVIPLLTDRYYVVAVSYDGFDETETTVFPDMITETEKIEQYINRNLSGTVHAVYGCSLGGSFVGLLVQRGNVHINHGILGSSDLDQDTVLKAKLKCILAVPLLHKIISTGSYPRLLQGLMEKKRTPYRDKFTEMFNMGKGGMPFVTKQSVYNQFYSDLVTPLAKGIRAPDTTIHVFYAQQMGRKYLDRYTAHFAQPVVHTFDMLHEELLVCHPHRWAEEIISCTLPESHS